jgi:hypothetical protein
MWVSNDLILDDHDIYSFEVYDISDHKTTHKLRKNEKGTLLN